MAQNCNNKQSQNNKIPGQGKVKQLIQLFEETLKIDGLPKLTSKTRGWKSSPSMIPMKIAIPSSFENVCDAKKTGPRVSLVFPGDYKDKSTQTSMEKLYMTENEIEGLWWLFK